MKTILAFLAVAFSLLTLEACSSDRNTGAYQQSTTTTTSRYSGK